MEKATVKDKMQQMKGQALEKMYPMLCSTGVVFAGVVGNSCYAEVDPEKLMGKIGEKVYDVFRYIGFILTLWGIGQLILAFKNEDADSKSRAIMCIASGVILFGLQTFVSKLDIKLGSS